MSPVGVTQWEKRGTSVPRVLTPHYSARPGESICRERPRAARFDTTRLGTEDPGGATGGRRGAAVLSRAVPGQFRHLAAAQPRRGTGPGTATAPESCTGTAKSRGRTQSASRAGSVSGPRQHRTAVQGPAAGLGGRKGTERWPRGQPSAQMALGRVGAHRGASPHPFCGEHVSKRHVSGRSPVCSTAAFAAQT